MASPNVPVFLSEETIKAPRELTIIADISCDPESRFNPIPIYERPTTFAKPVRRIVKAPNYLDIMAIDNLPSLLPVESSYDYAEQLLPCLLHLDQLEKGVWARAFSLFKHHSAN